jgi:threonine aldolase
VRTFRSDNTAGLCPEALRAIVDANDGAHVVGYGDDPFTADAVARFRDLFGPDTAVRLVATGTAANVLGIAALTDPWQQVLCHRHSHYHEDESTAPERITQCRTVACGRDETKVTVADVEDAAGRARGDVHNPQPGVVTVSNPTELGTVYTPGEMTALCDAAHAAGFRVHVDGARFANACAAVGCDPRALTVDAGVDAMSFGGTKNGLAAGEAVLLFPQGDGAAFARADHALPYLRKSTGHLLSKHRFIAAPFAATLRDSVWLRHAAHANAMARRLGDGLASFGLVPAYPVEANGIFVVLPAAVDAGLKAAGHGYYPFGDPALGLSRLMCSFDTAPEDVDAFLGCVSSAP